LKRFAPTNRNVYKRAKSNGKKRRWLWRGYGSMNRTKKLSTCVCAATSKCLPIEFPSILISPFYFILSSFLCSSHSQMPLLSLYLELQIILLFCDFFLFDFSLIPFFFNHHPFRSLACVCICMDFFFNNPNIEKQWKKGFFADSCTSSFNHFASHLWIHTLTRQAITNLQWRFASRTIYKEILFLWYQ
jgi:hypothetical protein